MLYHVKDLSPEQKLAIESLLRHPVSEEEAVSVKSLSPSAIIPSRLTPEERVQALEELNASFAAAKDELPKVSDAEEESIINEALRTTRPNYSPID